jgi:hypothetical protein
LPEESSSDICLKTTINITGTVTNASSASESDGSINATASGASGFMYCLNNGPYQSSGTFSNLTVGSYAVIARSSSGCIGSAQFTIGNGDLCAGINMVITATTTNATSASSSDGSITASATGGTGMQYKINTGNYQTSGNFTGLASGTYTITAKNSNGCSGTAQFSISAGNICATKNIVLSTASASSDKCTPTGTVTVNASGSTGFTYQINGSTYQSSNVFTALAPGSYTVAVKDLDNCTKSASVTVGVVNAGPLFSGVKTLIYSQCKPCHVNGGSNGGVNFDSDCNIVLKKDRIKARAVDGNPSPMPPNGPLTAAEKQKIVDWINAGGKYSN